MHRVVPELIVENYRNGRFGGEFPAIGMFLDLSGFSAMTDALMQHGQHGAEVLAGMMHGVFDPLVESIFEYGGKIVSFAGDGIMALFPINGDEKSTALHALASAWVIQQKLTENPQRKTIYGKFTFSAKIGLSAGSVIWRILRSKGGENATYYFRGPAVDDSAKAEHHANAGEIILTQTMHDLVEEDARTRLSESFHRFIRFRVEMPQKTVSEFPPVDLEISRVFMPEEVILDGVRGEFRQIVNLFIRIPDLPDDELESFINVIFELEKKYGGLVTRLDFGDKGCNMLLLWGAPLAYENDIGRAMNFILDLRSKADIPITAGVTYYIAHAGYLGSALCEDYTCYGWGVNLAARFMMNAPAGETWVDDRIAQRVSSRFAMDYVGSQRFKGFAAEQKVHVLRYRKMESEVIYQGEMFGREDEMGRMEKFIEPLWQGNFAGVLTVSGDAGIGKGRLIHEFASSELFNTHEVYWATCKADQILRQSFTPLRDWLLRYFRDQSSKDTDEQKTVFNLKLDNLLASISDPELVREIDRTRSFLGALIGLYWDGSLYSQLDSEARYNNTLLALVALLKAESLRQPVVLYVDDVQFIDADSFAFLSQLKRSLQVDSQSHSIAIILTLRKRGESLPEVDELSDVEIQLNGIEGSAISKLAEDILGGPISPSLMRLVMARSEGNPYFAGQIVRYLQEENQLEMSVNGWDRIERVRGSVLPSDIRALLVARLDKLTREVKSAVQTASVLGREFDIGVLSQMLGSEKTTKVHVLEAEKAAIWAPLSEILYIFQHGLLRDAAYSMQMRARRQELHILALNALEILHEDDLEGHYAELAYHAEHGNTLYKAQRYYTLAGKVSADLYRNADAVAHYTKALTLTDADDLETQFDLLVERVELYSRMGKRDLQSIDLDTLEKYAKLLNDRVPFAQTMILRARYFRTIGEFENAIQSAKSANDDIVADNSPDLAFDSYFLWASSLLRLGKPAEAMVKASTALEIAEKFERRLDKAKILSEMGLIALESDPGTAHAYLEESLIISRELKDRQLEETALINLALSEGSIKGNHSVARKLHVQAYEIAKELGDRYHEGIALVNLGFSAGMRGDFEAASGYHESSLKVAREVGNLSQEMYTLINLSAVTGLKQDALAALEFAKQAHALSRKMGDRSSEAWSELYIGHALLQMGDCDNAHTAYEKSIAIRVELQQPVLAMEPMAGLVESALCVNDLETARKASEKILAHLAGEGSLDGTEEPLRVYYACYRYLYQQKDPRAQQILERANQILDTQVSKFKDERSRKLFVENFPWRQALRDAAGS